MAPPLRPPPFNGTVSAHPPHPAKEPSPMKTTRTKTPARHNGQHSPRPSRTAHPGRKSSLPLPPGTRAPFVIDPQGIIQWSYVSPPGVNPGADGILKALESLPTKNEPQPTQEPAHAASQ